MPDPVVAPRALSLLARFRLVSVLVVLGVLGGMAWQVTQAWQQFEQARQARQAVQRLRVTLVAAEMVSRERGPMNGALGEHNSREGARDGALWRARLQQARARTDAAFDAYLQELDALPSGAGNAPRYQQARRELMALRESLGQVRKRADSLIAQPISERWSSSILDVILAMADLVPRLSPAMTLLADEAQQAAPVLESAVWGARMAAELRERAGLLGSLFTPALIRKQPFTVQEQERVDQAWGRIDELRHLMVLRLAASSEGSDVQREHARMVQRFFVAGADQLSDVQYAGRTHGRYEMSPAQFAERYVPELDTIVALRDAHLREAEQLSIDARERAGVFLAGCAAATVALLLLVLAGLRSVRRRIVLPLMQSAQALRAMGQGHFDWPLPTVQTSREIAEVIQGIDALRQQSQARIGLERERDQLIETLREQSRTDFLTGLANRRAFFEAASPEMARGQRHGFGLVLLLLDVDHFKRINDQLGHAVGDLALKAVAQVLRQCMRQGDLAARLGGEEFVVLLSHCSRDAGLAFAERLRQRMAAEVIDVGGAQPALRLTVSIGLADSFTHGGDVAALLNKADEAMYQAKHAGRNRTQWALA